MATANLSSTGFVGLSTGLLLSSTLKLVVPGLLVPGRRPGGAGRLGDETSPRAEVGIFDLDLPLHDVLENSD